jgi:ABC-type transport system involved in multi-copper enzyme maturation permease subunit
MSILHYPLKVLLYGVIFFGIIDILPDFKAHIEIIASIIIFITFASVAAPPKPYFFTPLLFSALVILAAPGVYTFIIALVNGITVEAIDCEGHTVEGAWLNNTVIAISIAIFTLGVYYFTGRRMASSMFERLLAGMGILILLAYFWLPSYASDMNTKIDAICKPNKVLPADC